MPMYSSWQIFNRNQQKINNVIALDSTERYNYLIRKVADFKTIYLVAVNDDRVGMIGSDRANVLPVWPEKKFAKRFLTDEWKDYKVVAYSVNEFMDLLGDLEKEEIELAGFPNLALHTVHVSAIDMRHHLLDEISLFE